MGSSSTERLIAHKPQDVTHLVQEGDVVCHQDARGILQHASARTEYIVEDVFADVGVDGREGVVQEVEIGLGIDGSGQRDLHEGEGLFRSTVETAYTGQLGG